MFFLKKSVLCILFVVFMYFGGAGTQSDNTSLQGAGFIGVVLGFVVLYILFKIMWTAMRATLTFLVLGSIVLFILYCLGLVGSGDSKSANKFSEAPVEYNAMAENTATNVLPELEPVGMAGGKDSNDNGSAKEAGFFDKINNLMKNQDEEPGMIELNPLDYPAVKGKPQVITGSVLFVKGIYVKLLGIDAPMPEQNCSNSKGIAYECGQKAIIWLQNWLNNQSVECRIVGDVVQHKATGVCFLGKYDVAAAIVNAGWAVAYTKNTVVYLPYENSARDKRRGLWSGRFYRPSDWRKMQNINLKAINESNKSKSFDFNFDGWF